MHIYTVYCIYIIFKIVLRGLLLPTCVSKNIIMTTVKTPTVIHSSCEHVFIST